VAVTGKLTSRQYDNKEGKKVTVFEIVADAFDGVEFLDGKKQGGSQSNEIDMTEPIPF
jgi:single-strand DNA-binding protein